MASSSTNRRIFLAQAGSLLATAWLVWQGAFVPRLHSQALPAIVGRALEYALIAWVWAAVIAFGLYALVRQQERNTMLPDVFRTAATAVWFGPAMILLSEFSPAAFLAALVLVIYATRLLYTQWTSGAEAPTVGPYAARVAGSFADCLLPQGFVWRDRLPSIAVAITMQAGAIAVAMHYPLLGAGLFCLTTAMLTMYSMATGAAGPGKPPTLPRSIIGVVATVIMAAILTMAGEMSFGGDGAPGFGAGGYGQRPGLMASARIMLRRLFYGESPAGSAGAYAANRNPKMPDANQGPLGGYPGVILWPEIKQVTMLVAPLPESGDGLLFHGPHPKPLSIPFGGEYWMFRWPYARPPQRSYFQRGTPTKFSFSTTDHARLQMEAHHKLETPIAVNCCGRIDLEILNADRYAGTTSIELVLLDNEGKIPRFLSLGFQPVLSKADTSQDPVAGVREMLQFPVPPTNALTQFDEFKVVYQRRRAAFDRSERIAVERFVLVPR